MDKPGVYIGFKRSSAINTGGSFEIQVNVINNISFLVLIASHKEGIMIIEPGQTYHVDFNFTKNGNIFTVAGKNDQGQNYYNTLPNPGTIGLTKLTDEFSMDTTALAIANSISYRRSEEMKRFKQLQDEKKITSLFYDFVKSDRDCYYASLTASIVRSRYYRTPPANLKSFSADLKNLWNQTFVDYLPTSSTYIRTRWWLEYAENYIQFKEYTRDDFSIDTLLKLREENRMHSHQLTEASKHLTGDMLSYYTAYYFFINAFLERNDKELVELYDKFINQFPNNAYSSFIKPLIEPIREFHAKSDKEEKPSLNFVDNYSQLNTLQELLNHFKGKPIFLDLWASWCGPCLQEFKYKDSLIELLDKHGYTCVYVSIDTDRNNDQWIDKIKKYNLSIGYHIRANESMTMDLVRLFGKQNSLAIPRYVIVDENGTIKESDAARPSEMEKLERQLVKN
ncbi:MAG: TlpA family protein disulfide reductase [Cytophagia bacterium]|nr:TlpA family protein disulfide reductase [Cytophagia bacterium]